MIIIDLQFSLAFDLKVSIINLLIEDVMGSSDFRTFFENNISLIEELKRKLKMLQSEVNYRITGKLNHSLREITKTQAKLERAESMIFSKKKICVDSHG